MSRYIDLHNSSAALIKKRTDPLKLPSTSTVPMALVKIVAFGINRADLLQKAGFYPPPPGVTDILGLEFSGVIEALHDKDSSLKVGDRVMGICAGGAYAEHIIVPRDQLMVIPDEWSFERAAAVPEVYLTAFDALINQGSLRPGEKVLIHAIGSGGGVAAAHLAHFFKAEVTGTTRSPWKREKGLKELPVSKIWLSEGGHPFPPEQGESPEYNLIIDLVGAAYLPDNIKALALNGRLVVVGLLGGIKGELHLGRLLAKRAKLIGTVLRSRSSIEKINLSMRFQREILTPYREKVISTEYLPFVGPSQVYPPEDVLSAYELLEESRTWSKVVCKWSD